MDVRPALSPFALAEVPRGTGALGAVERCHVEHLAQTSEVALGSTQGATPISGVVRYRSKTGVGGESGG